MNEPVPTDLLNVARYNWNGRGYFFYAGTLYVASLQPGEPTLRRVGLLADLAEAANGLSAKLLDLVKDGVGDGNIPAPVAEEEG